MNRLKTGMIVLLSGLAIYLASQLWFANAPSRNFFYTFFARPEPSGANDSRMFARPYRFIINFGNNKFLLEYGGMDSNILRETCDGVIQSLLKDGAGLAGGLRPLNYTDALGAPGYIYQYAFGVPPAAFGSAFGKNNFAEQLKNITSVVFIPPDAIRTETIVWLLDEENMEMSGYSVKAPVPPITTNPDDLSQEIIYGSSVLGLYGFPGKNLFIAQKRAEPYRYLSISVKNPYAEDELLMTAVEKNVNRFFENPAAKLSFIGDNNVYTFSDADTVVKYYQNDVLEYSNYRLGDAGADLLRSFSAALNFIKADALVINEYYLAGFAPGDNGYTFYFDYVVNGLPLILPDEYKRGDAQGGSASLDHALQITVREGAVVNYKKIVYNFITDTTSKTAALDFSQFLAGNAGGGQISDVLLGYKLERTKKAYIYWIINMGGQTFSKIG